MHAKFQAESFILEEIRGAGPLHQRKCTARCTPAKIGVMKTLHQRQSWESLLVSTLGQAIISQQPLIVFKAQLQNAK